MFIKALAYSILLASAGLLVGPVVAVVLMPGPVGGCGLWVIGPLAVGAVGGTVCGAVLGFLLGLLF